LKKIAETRIGPQGQIYVNKAIRFALEADIGDTIEWLVENSRIEVRKKESK
jgi:bifunctional DNA-binding transcriptional regulator/antitoxin component of YhaV-PrlF toxin-antitoxin module